MARRAPHGPWQRFYRFSAVSPTRLARAQALYPFDKPVPTAAPTRAERKKHKIRSALVLLIQGAAAPGPRLATRPPAATNARASATWRRSTRVPAETMT